MVPFKLKTTMAFGPVVAKATPAGTRMPPPPPTIVPTPSAVAPNRLGCLSWSILSGPGYGGFASRSGFFWEFTATCETRDIGHRVVISYWFGSPGGGGISQSYCAHRTT